MRDKIGTPPDSTREPGSGREFTAERARILLFLSFRFSQGDQDLQRKIFVWVHRRYPEYKINGNMYDQILVSTTSMNQAYVFKDLGSKHPSHGLGNDAKFRDEDISSATSNALYEMKEIFNDNNRNYRFQHAVSLNAGDPDLILQICDLILQQDLEYVRREKGRSRNISYTSSKPETDPWSSQFIDYGFRGLTTGLPEYNAMFREIIAVFKNHNRGQDEEQEERLAKLLEIIKIYNDHHEVNQKIDLVSLMKE